MLKVDNIILVWRSMIPNPKQYLGKGAAAIEITSIHHNAMQCHVMIRH